MEQEKQTELDFRIGSGELSTLLQSIAKIVPATSTLPILTNLLFEVEEGYLRLTASDSLLRITGSLPLASHSGNFSFAARPKDMVDYVKELPDQPLHFKYNSETMETVVVFSTGEFAFPSVDASLYPKGLSSSAPYDRGDEEEIQHTTTMDVDNFCKALKVTIPAVSVKSSIPVLGALCMDFQAQGVTLVASNQRILNMVCNHKKVDVPTEGKADKVLLPLKTATFLKDFFSRYSGEDMQVSYSMSRASFVLGSVEVTTLLVQGRFPDYMSLFKMTNPTNLELDGKLFLAVLKRMSSFFHDENAHLKMTLGGGKMSLIASVTGDPKTAQEVLPAEFPQDLNFTMDFSLQEMLLFISSIGDTNIQLSYFDPTKSLLLSYPDPQEDFDVTGLIVPKVAVR